MKQTCEVCRWSKQHREEHGEIHLYWLTCQNVEQPPFPTVESDDFCKSWQLKEELRGTPPFEGRD